MSAAVSECVCWSCKKPLSLTAGTKIAFRADCEFCGTDLHCCRSCSFFDENAYNQCREPQAERITDKLRANYCEYHLYLGVSGPQTGADAAKETALKKLDDLFK
jgi:hypothetical protein